MRTAVCVHHLGQTERALHLYNRIRQIFPNYAYVQVNLGVLALKNGDIRTCIALTEEYFREVGGIFGDSTTRDDSAK